MHNTVIVSLSSIIPHRNTGKSTEREIWIGSTCITINSGILGPEGLRVPCWDVLATTNIYISRQTCRLVRRIGRTCIRIRVYITIKVLPPPQVVAKAECATPMANTVMIDNFLYVPTP